jgi:thioredoxin-like negative regulator of GroEL
LPVLDDVASGYLDDVKFLAVAGRSTEAETRERAGEWFSDNISWTFDMDIWSLYGVFGQPTTFLIDDGRVLDMWFGALGEEQLREKLDGFIAATR